MSKKLKKGQVVTVALSGAGVVTREQRTILKVDKHGIWLDNGSGNDPTGPFDLATLRMSGAFGFSQRIEP